MSNKVEWIKITTSMFDDDKIKLIESLPDRDTLLVIWIKLLVQAGKCNASGHLIISETIPCDDEILATLFGRPITTIRMALDTFQRLGIIERSESIFIANWDKHQNIQTLDKIRELTRARVKKHRENSKLLPVTLHETLRNATRIEIREKEKEEKSKPLAPISISTPPAETKPKRPRPKTEVQISEHAWFVQWWCWAVQKLTAERYPFDPKDARLIFGMLTAVGFDTLMNRAGYYLTLGDDQRYPRGSPNIPGLQQMFKQIAGKGTAVTDATLVRWGLLPADMHLAAFHPWKDTNEQTRTALR